MSELLTFIRENFAHVAPILIAGGFGLAIVLERFWTLYLAFPLHNTESFFDRIRAHLMSGETNEALAVCDRYSSKPVASVVKEGLLRAHQPESLIECGLELAVDAANRRVQKRTSFLAMIANVATLLGLLGTIMGLIEAFAAMGASDAQAKATLLAKGISTAMNATVLGLCVAVPCMIAFSLLMNRTHVLVQDIETSATRILDLIKQRYLINERKNRGPGGSGGPSGKAA